MGRQITYANTNAASLYSNSIFDRTTAVTPDSVTLEHALQILADRGKAPKRRRAAKASGRTTTTRKKASKKTTTRKKAASAKA